MKKVKVSGYKFTCTVTLRQAIEWNNDWEKTIYVCDNFEVDMNSQAFDRIESAFEKLLIANKIKVR